MAAQVIALVLLHFTNLEKSPDPTTRGKLLAIISAPEAPYFYATDSLSLLLLCFALSEPPGT
ncbi:MAG: hypothetical protein BRC40_07170 [Cyanobacteria bacterium QH_8_48_120]|nr:MAG: hypothetical protein BRC34_04285 [Cyanobacteria bacterium QH_1_48_107]PSO68062.1 MAG: hypothetical protein BRC38_02265 [Cyanobacteria bacterium QH_6_48_35]PSO74225.1 MAG: hypothetical protein BRC40_07170 [Cyanobacteria bacterium QH_8_48_120]